MISCSSFETITQDLISDVFSWEKIKGLGGGIKDAKTISTYPEVMIAVASKFLDSVLIQKSKHTSTSTVVSDSSLVSSNQKHV